MNNKCRILRWTMWLCPALCIATAVLIEGCMSRKRLEYITPLSGSSYIGGTTGGYTQGAQLPIGPGEEVWILARGEGDASSAADDIPGSGSLMAQIEEKQ